MFHPRIHLLRSNSCTVGHVRLSHPRHTQLSLLDRKPTRYQDTVSAHSGKADTTSRVIHSSWCSRLSFSCRKWLHISPGSCQASSRTLPSVACSRRANGHVLRPTLSLLHLRLLHRREWRWDLSLRFSRCGAGCCSTLPFTFTPRRRRSLAYS